MREHLRLAAQSVPPMARAGPTCGTLFALPTAMLPTRPLAVDGQPCRVERQQALVTSTSKDCAMDSRRTPSSAAMVAAIASSLGLARLLLAEV